LTMPLLDLRNTKEAHSNNRRVEIGVVSARIIEAIRPRPASPGVPALPPPAR
jgi:hypothetical protein